MCSGFWSLLIGRTTRKFQGYHPEGKENGTSGNLLETLMSMSRVQLVSLFFFFFSVRLKPHQLKDYENGYVRVASRVNSITQKGEYVFFTDSGKSNFWFSNPPSSPHSHPEKWSILAPIFC